MHKLGVVHSKLLMENKYILIILTRIQHLSYNSPSYIDDNPTFITQYPYSYIDENSTFIIQYT